MDLDQLESALRSVHSERGIYPHEVVAPIERGNYSLRSLLRAVMLMNLRLAIDGSVVWTEADVGSQLRLRRQQQGLSLRAMEQASGLTRAQVMRIEHGQGCQKATLGRYLGAVPAEFRLDR